MLNSLNQILHTDTFIKSSDVIVNMGARHVLDVVLPSPSDKFRD